LEELNIYIHKNYPGVKKVELLEKAGEHVISKGAEIVILGCTEIGLVLRKNSLSRPSIDPMDVIAETMIEKGQE